MAHMHPDTQRYLTCACTLHRWIAFSGSPEPPRAQDALSQLTDSQLPQPARLPRESIAATLAREAREASRHAVDSPPTQAPVSPEHTPASESENEEVEEAGSSSAAHSPSHTLWQRRHAGVGAGISRSSGSQLDCLTWDGKRFQKGGNVGVGVCVKIESQR